MKKLMIVENDLVKNISIIKSMAYSTRIMAVLKGNGYGLDIVKFATLLFENGIDFFAVSEAEEAVKLRNTGLTCDILLLSATSIYEEALFMIQHNIILSVGSLACAEVIDRAANTLNITPKVHLKMDTGFGRFGFLEDETEQMLALKQYRFEITGTFTHFSYSFSKKAKDIKVQFDAFTRIIEKLKEKGLDTGFLHACNSCAFLKYPSMHLDGVRVGSAFLGRLPIENRYGLNKIAHLAAQVSEIKELPKGHNIGYANTYKTRRQTKIAVINAGYMDGLLVEKSKDVFRMKDIARYMVKDLLLLKERKHYVNIKGRKYPLLGRVGMYNVIADITGADISVGDYAIFNVNPIMIKSELERNYV